MFQVISHFFPGQLVCFKLFPIHCSWNHS